MEDNPQRPNIHLFGVWQLLQNLGSSIANGSIRISGGLIGTEKLGKTEVNELWNRVLCPIGHHDVLKFQVSMDYSILVEVVEGLGDLLGELPCLHLCYLETFFFQVVVHVPTLKILEHNVEVLEVFEDID